MIFYLTRAEFKIQVFLPKFASHFPQDLPSIKIELKPTFLRLYGKHSTISEY